MNAPDSRTWAIIAALRHNREWSDIGSMTWREFSARRDEILAGALAIMDQPQSRKRFRTLAVYEGGSNELLAEMFSTTHGPIVVYRSAEDLGAGVARRDRDRLSVSPLGNDPDQRFVMVSRRAEHIFMNRDFRRWAVQGPRHTVWPNRKV